MKKTVIAMLIFSFLMVGTLTYIGLRFEDNVKEYNALENDIEEAAQIYLDYKDLELAVGESIRVTVKDLKKEDLLTTTAVEDDECEGYVIIKKNFNEHEYNSYIKCEYYETVDYDKN